MLKRKRTDGRPPKDGSSSRLSSTSSTPARPQPDQAVRSFEASYVEVLRELKKARGFERQRLAKRMAEETKQGKKGAKRRKQQGFDGRADGVPDVDADADAGSNSRLARLQREMQVLRTLDLEITARVHLANVLLRAKPLADRPLEPFATHLRDAAAARAHRPERPGSGAAAGDIHNVTSALYNRPFVREAVDKAVQDVCRLLCVPAPERAQRKRKQEKETEKEEKKKTWSGEAITTSQKGNKRSKDDARTIDEDEGDSDGGDHDDDEEIERELARQDALVGGSSDSDRDGDDDDEAISKEAIDKLRARHAVALAKGVAGDSSDDRASDSDSDEAVDDDDSFGGFSSGEDDDDDEDGRNENGDTNDDGDDSDNTDDSDDSDDLRPARKRNATAGAVTASHFLPTLMGGYVSDGDSDAAADDDEAAARLLAGARKNRRGQRARRAIWEKKFKAQAKHLQQAEASEAKAKAKATKKTTDGKTAGWDAKRGAVDANDVPRWLRRKRGQRGPSAAAAAQHAAAGNKNNTTTTTTTNKNKQPAGQPQPSGPLHPSWEAARKAKEKAQTAAFAGKKIVFD